MRIKLHHLSPRDVIANKNVIDIRANSELSNQSNLSFVLAKQNENPRVPFCTSLRHDVACTSQAEAGQKTIKMFVYASSDEK